MAGQPAHVRRHDLLRPYCYRAFWRGICRRSTRGEQPSVHCTRCGISPQDVWGDQLQSRLKCLVSISTGVLPPLKSIPGDVFGIGTTLKELTTETETEKTAERFQRDKSDLDDEGRYYRLNVDRGLEDIGLEESKKKRRLQQRRAVISNHRLYSGR
jgi:hypothetical protein